MEWLEYFIPILLPILRDVVILLVLSVASFSLSKWRQIKIDDWIKELIVTAVLFTQEKYWDMSGKQKFEIAKQWVISQLEKHKIPIDEEFIDALIDAIVKELRAQFGEDDWYRKEE